MHAAAASGCPKIVSLLIEAGASINVFDESGKLPLHCALNAQNDNSETVRILLKHGADVNAPDEKGRTPIFDAIWSLQWRERNALRQLETILAGQPDLEIIDPEWDMTALEYAHHLGLRKAMQLLRNAGAPEILKDPIDEDEGVWEISKNEHGGEVRVRIGDSDSDENTDEYGDPLCVKLPDDFDWRNSSDHIRYLAYLKKPNLPYYENWLNIAGESGPDAVARLIREGALTLCDATARGSVKYTVSELKNMIAEADQKPKQKKADLLEQAQIVAAGAYESGIRDFEMYVTTQSGADAVDVFQGRS